MRGKGEKARERDRKRDRQGSANDLCDAERPLRQLIAQLCQPWVCACVCVFVCACLWCGDEHILTCVIS